MIENDPRLYHLLTDIDRAIMASDQFLRTNRGPEWGEGVIGVKRYSQKHAVQAGCFLALIVCLFFFSVVFGNRTLTSLQVPGVLGGGPYGYTGAFTHRALIDPGGSTWSPRPLASLAHQQFMEGLVPLWNPYMGVGQPLAGVFDSNVFNPLRILLHLNPSPYMWDLFLLSRLFLAGLFTYLFMRALTVSPLCAIFSASLFMFSGYFILAIDMHHLDVEIFLPFILLCYEKLLQKAGLLQWGLLCALGVVFLINGGQPQSTFLILVFGFAYYVFRLLSVPGNRRPMVLGKFVAIYALPHLLGFALSAPILLPFLEFWGLSFNNHDPRPGHIVGLMYNHNFSDVVSFVVPYFTGPPHYSWLEGYSGHIRATGYFGMTASLFALVAVLTARRKRSAAHTPIYFFTIALLFMLAKLYGFSLVNSIGGLPVASLVNFGKYLGPLMALCVAVLAGMGLETVARGGTESSTGLNKSSRILTLLILCTFFYFLRYMVDHSEIVPGLARVSPLLGYSVVNLVLLHVAVTLLCMGAILWALHLCRRETGFAGRTFQVCILIIGLIELFIYIPNPGFSKDRNMRGDIFKKAPYIDFLQSHLGGHRVVGVDGILYPDFGSAFGIGDLRVLDSLLPKRYMEFLGAYFRLPSPPDRFTGNEGIDFGDQSIRRALNLLGVKYFIALSDLSGDVLVDDILKRGKIVYFPGEPLSHWINAANLDINGIIKRIVFAHPPARIDYTVRVPEQASFEFSIGLVPGSWAPDKGDGVLFEIFLQDGGQETKVFSKYIDPKNRAQDRKWFDESIDLGRYAGRDVVLGLVTSPGQDSSFDWSAWGEPRWAVRNDDTKLRPVYNREVRIYDNDRAFPRAFVVHDYEFLSGKEAILRRLKSSDFPLRDKIIVEETIPEGVRSRMVVPHLENSEARITRYDSQHVEILAEMKRPGFLVLSDLYYPGWSAYVDGNKGKIYQTDYILRSVLLEEGNHTVQFVYEPRSFRIGLWISGAALFVVIILLGTALLRRRHHHPEAS